MTQFNISTKYIPTKFYLVINKKDHTLNTRAGEEVSQRTGGQETRDLRLECPWNRQGPDCRSRPEGEGSGLSKWRWKDGTKKGEITGVDRDAREVEGDERGANGRGKRRQKQARGVGIKGRRGTMGSRLREVRQKEHIWEVEDGGSVSFYRWKGDPRLYEKGDNRAKESDEAQSKGGGRRGRKDTKGEGDFFIENSLQLWSED